MAGKFKGLMQEFRDFAFKGSAVDLAVGVIIGAAFNSFVQSIVKDVLMPFISFFTGRISFENWTIPPSTAFFVKWPKIELGGFISALINFLIVALCVFFLIKFIGRFRKEEEEKPKAASADERSAALLSEIRDLLEDMRDEKQQKSGAD